MPAELDEGCRGVWEIPCEETCQEQVRSLVEIGRAQGPALFPKTAGAMLLAQGVGQVSVEGHADSDRVSSLAFPDNTALSKARAETVAAILRSQLSDPARVTAEGYGDTRPIASNDTAEGKSLNRRVEIVVPRRS